MDILSSSSKEVDAEQIIQLESAIGSVIKIFDYSPSTSIVPRARLVQIKTTSDLLLLQSDLFSSAEGNLVRNPARVNPVDPSIDLGPEFHKVSDFLRRFKSIPSIVELDRLTVSGDVWFGANVTLKGSVIISAKHGAVLVIPDGAVLQDKEIFDNVHI